MFDISCRWHRLTLNRVPIQTYAFKGLPHGFRRYGEKLSASKRWDEVTETAITWALSRPEPTGKFSIVVW